jgi:hypothetical protein
MLALTLNGTTEYLNTSQKEDAMRRYWTARQAGDATARLVEVDHPPQTDDDDDDDPDDPPPAPAGSVSSLAESRIQLQEQWLSEAGFSLAPPLFAPGTRVLPLGDDNFRLERQRVVRLPHFPIAASGVRECIRAEARQDVPVTLNALTMTDTGRLQVGQSCFGVEDTAFAQLAGLAGFGKGARYLRDLCPPGLRAVNVNHQFQALPKRKLMLRTRIGPEGERQVFAAVSPRYAAVDTDQVLTHVQSALRDAHTEMLYDGQGVHATALWMPDQVVDLAAGDIFKAGVRVETDDTGRGRIRIAGVVWRNRCLNLIIIGEGTVETVSAVHRGRPGRILAQLASGVDAARKSVANFLEAWGHARTVKVEPEKIFKKWVATKRVQVRGERDNQAIVDELLAAWQKEPGDTLADAVNAVTRAAHETSRWDAIIQRELERQAAQLVYVRR